MDAQGNTDVIDNVKKGWHGNFFERYVELFFHCFHIYNVHFRLRIKRVFGYGHASLPD
jgi:hypothetical protein